MPDPMPPIAISKTRLLHYLQCPKRLWLEQYSPELADEDAIDQAAIETGRAVAEKAREVLGRGAGHLVSHDRGLRSAVAETRALLEAGGNDPIFEATFDHGGLTVLIDVLDRSGEAPRIIEVKSSTRVKDHFLADCAIQAWTLGRLGMQPSGTGLALINDEFEYAGDGNYEGLFREVDLTHDLGPHIAQVADAVQATRETLASLDEPAREIGSHCMSPHPCPFFAHCSPARAESPTATQERIRRRAEAREPRVSAELKGPIEALGYPRYFLAFEAIAFAIPIWPGTRPYEALPFQWSCHVDDGSGSLRHEEFLDTGGDPPMRRLAEALIGKLGASGAIVVSTADEKHVLNGLAARFPDLATALEALVERVFDAGAARSSLDEVRESTGPGRRA